MTSTDLNLHRLNIFTNAGFKPCPGYGEDGVIKKIFELIGTSKKPYCVEFGEMRSLGTTSRFFRINFISDSLYFSGSLDFRSRVLNILDIFKICITNRNLKFLTFLFNQPKKRFITVQNCAELLAPLMNREVDLFVADIDSYDFEIVTQVIESITRPKVLIVEYNPNLPYDRILFWKQRMQRTENTNARLYGASYGAWMSFLEAWDYRLVHVSGFCNLIFVRGDINHEFVQPIISEEITDSKKKVLDFAAKYCLPGFRPSWLDAPYLTDDELDSLK